MPSLKHENQSDSSPQQKQTPEKAWSVYIVRCHNQSLYTGIATDVARRFSEHASGGNKCAKFLRGKGPLELLFQQQIGNRSLATKVEMKIKKLSKAQKESLIKGHKPLTTLINLDALNSSG